jgi:hypothetical protein
MIRVTIELIPHGNEAQKWTLGVMHIINRGGDDKEANYHIVEMINDIQEWETIATKRDKNIFTFLMHIFSARKPA